MSANRPLPRWADIALLPLLNLVLAFVVSGLVVLMIGQNPLTAMWAILTGACDAGRYGVAALMLLLLLGVFLGMGAKALKVVQGRPSWEARQSAHRDTWMNASPIVVLLLLALGAGIALPPPATALLHEAARLLEGVP